MTINDATNVRQGIFILTIEGVGDEAGLYRFTWSTSPGSTPVDLSFDVDNLYRRGLVGWPREIETSVDFLAGEARPGQQTFTLSRTSETLAWLWTVDASPITRLVDTMTATTQTLKFEEGDHADLQNTVIYAEREAIRIGTLGSTVSGVSTYISCMRGHLGTQALPHGGEGRDPEVYHTISSETLLGRLVRLSYVPKGAASYDDEELVYVGPLREVSTSHAGEFTLSVGTLLDLIRRGRICRDMWSRTTGQSRLEATVRPDAGHASDHRALFCVDGEAIVVGRWVQVGEERYQVEMGQAVQGSPPLEERDASDLEGVDVVEVITSLVEQPSNNETTSTSTLPLSQDVGDLILQLLTSIENDGVGGTNGAWDTGVNNLAGSVPVSVVDTEQIIAWAAQYGTQKIDNLILGHDGSEDVYDLLQRLVRAFGGVLVPGPRQIRIAQMRSIAPYGVASRISQGQVLNVGVVQRRNLAQAVDRVEVEYNGFPGRDPDVTTGENEYRRRRLPRGVRDGVTIDATFIRDSEAASLLSTNLLLRYHQPPPEVLVECLRTADFVPGDVVLLTHDKVLGNGVVGVTDAPHLVIGRRDSLSGAIAPGGSSAGEHRVHLRCLYVGALFQNAGLIGPSARVTGWDAGTRTLTLSTNEYTGAAGALGSDSSGFVVGDAVDIVDEFGVVVDVGLEVEAVPGPGQVKLSTIPASAPAVGDVLYVSAWTGAAAAQRAVWAFIADYDNKIGGAVANAYQYT